MSFEDKVILVTGAASGIGAHAARYFAEKKARLALVDKNETGLSATGRDCEEGTQLILIVADLTHDDDVERVVQRTIASFGRLDILANVVGAFEYGGIESTSPAQLDRMLAVNVKTAYHLTTLVVPYLIATRGAIINVSSCLSMMVQPRILAYSMAKAAMDHFTKSVAVELAPKGVRVNAVNPGVVRTALFDGVVSDPKGERQMYAEMTPLGREGTVEDVVNAMGFLVSDEASYMTGTTVAEDGALHLSKR